MGAKAIKLQFYCRFMGQTSCILLGLECHVWHMYNGKNVMEYFKMMCYLISDTGILGKNQSCYPFAPLIYRATVKTII